MKAYNIHSDRVIETSKPALLSRLVADLQDALGHRMVCGQITLHFGDGLLQSIETRSFQKVRTKAVTAALVDKSLNSADTAQ